MSQMTRIFPKASTMDERFTCLTPSAVPAFEVRQCGNQLNLEIGPPF